MTLISLDISKKCETAIGVDALQRHLAAKEGAIRKRNGGAHPEGKKMVACIRASVACERKERREYSGIAQQESLREEGAGARLARRKN